MSPASGWLLLCWHTFSLVSKVARFSCWHSSCGLPKVPRCSFLMTIIITSSWSTQNSRKIDARFQDVNLICSLALCHRQPMLLNLSIVVQGRHRRRFHYSRMWADTHRDRECNLNPIDLIFSEMTHKPCLYFFIHQRRQFSLDYSDLILIVSV